METKTPHDEGTEIGLRNIMHGGNDQGNSSEQWMYGEGNGGSDYKWSQPTQWKFNKEKGKNFFLPRFFGSILDYF